jgi:hypothetical protein
MMGNPNTILDFFKRKNAQSSNAIVGDALSQTSDIVVSENSSKNSRRVDVNEFDISSLEFDSGLRRQIWRSIMLINGMKFGEFTLNLVCTN